MSDVLSEEAVTTRTCRRWLVKLCLDDFFLNNEPRSGRSSDVSDEDIRIDVMRSIASDTFKMTHSLLHVGYYGIPSIAYYPTRHLEK
ncbi:hypothetical protein TNCV_1348461 [Trichonephila clavipes]|nr:hypothetical protein TNCV_1348461 [Trichonephila clavipes]